MERLLDKATVLACCCAMLVLGGGVTQATAALSFAAVLMSAAAELAYQTGRPAVAIGCAASICVATIALPQGIALIPLAAYDLVRAYRGLPALAALAAIISAAARAEGAPCIPSLCLTCAAALLALRTGHAIAQSERNHRMRDDLQERALSLEAKNRDLIDRQGYEIDLATLSERARIAREMHDTIGHLLTRAGLQVEAFRVLHEGDEELQREFSSVSDTLAEALASVRQSVHDLHDDSVSLSVQVERVVEKVMDASNLDVDVDIAVERVPAAVAACFTAIVREALSNTLRHSDATHAQVRCLEHPAFWQLTVVDGGGGRVPGSPSPDMTSALAGALGSRAAAGPFLGAAAKPDVQSNKSPLRPAPSAGLGLSSMRERVESLGGQFRAGFDPDAHGFKVFATIPKGGAA